MLLVFTQPGKACNHRLEFYKYLLDYLKIFISLTAFLTFVNGCSTVIYVFKPLGLTRSKGSLGEMGETKEPSSFFLNKHLGN